jgi:hypothetical protein
MLVTLEQPGCRRISSNGRAIARLASKVEASPFATSLRSVCDLVLQVAGLMIAAELTQRRFVELKQNLAQFLGFGITGGETLSVNLTQRADESISVLVADFAVVVAVPIVETCLAHAALLVPRTTASTRRDQMAILRRNTSRLGLSNDLARRGSFSAPGTVSFVMVDGETGEDIIRVVLA